MKLISATAWAALVAGVVCAALAALALTLPVPPAARSAPPIPAADAASAPLQGQLNGLAADVLGPDRVVVTANVATNQNRSSSSALRYGKRGTTLQSSIDKTSAVGDKRRVSSAQWSHDEKLVNTIYAPGAVQRVELGVVVDASVPAKTVKALKRELSTAAGLQRKRGDRISVTQTGFPTTQASALAPLANAQVRSLLGLARWVFLGCGVIVFAWLSTLQLSRREIVPASPRPASSKVRLTRS